MAEGPDPHPGKLETFGLFSNTGPDPLENQSYQASIPYWAIIAPPAFCCWADDGPLLVVF